MAALSNILFSTSRAVQYQSCVPKSLSSSTSSLIAKFPGVPSNREGTILRHASRGHRPSFKKPYRLDVRAVRELTRSILRGEGLRFAVVAATSMKSLQGFLLPVPLKPFINMLLRTTMWISGVLPPITMQLQGLLHQGVPVIFGILTTENMDQRENFLYICERAIDRAGGKVGNKGAEAALTAIEMASLFKHQIMPLRDSH